MVAALGSLKMSESPFHFKPFQDLLMNQIYIHENKKEHFFKKFGKKNPLRFGRGFGLEVDHASAFVSVLEVLRHDAGFLQDLQDFGKGDAVQLTEDVHGLGFGVLSVHYVPFMVQPERRNIEHG